MGIPIEVRGEQTARREEVLNDTSTALVAELEAELGPRSRQSCWTVDSNYKRSSLVANARPSRAQRPISAAEHGACLLPRQT